MRPLRLSAQRLARDFGVDEKTILQILAGRRRVSLAMAHKLHMRFKTSTQFWLNLQNRFDTSRLKSWEDLARGS